MNNSDLEKKIAELAGKPPKSKKGWIVYGALMVFIGGYTTGSYVVAAQYKEEVRKSLSEAHRPPEEELKGFDLFKEVEAIDNSLELPPPYKF